VVENTYFAEMIIQRNGGVISVDARPSDSIAVDLRMKAKIFADEGLLEEATVEVPEEESVTLGGESFGEPKSPEIKAEDLRDYLRKLDPEDFGRFTP